MTRTTTRFTGGEACGGACYYSPLGMMHYSVVLYILTFPVHRLHLELPWKGHGEAVLVLWRRWWIGVRRFFMPVLASVECLLPPVSAWVECGMSSGDHGGESAE